MCNRIQTEKDASGACIIRLRTDHGENASFAEYCNEKGIKHEFSIAAQQKGEKKGISRASKCKNSATLLG